MRTTKCITLSLLAWACCLELPGQVDTVVTLPVLEVATDRLRHRSVGSVSQQWDALVLARLPTATVADLLQWQTGSFIKSYGLGSLATSAIRGGSASHTLVLWNGVPIQSPMLGQVDLSLLPGQDVGTVTLQKGGQSALWGSAALGGVLAMAHQPDFDKFWSVGASGDLGSYGLRRQRARWALGSQRWSLSTRLSHQQADNDFRYTPGPGRAAERQSNAALQQLNIMQDVYWRPSPTTTLGLHFWQQYSDREIPPTLVQTRSAARQEDQATRGVLDFTLVGDKWRWLAKAAYFDERLDYFDEGIRLSSLSHFRTIFSEVSGQWIDGPHRLLIGATHNYSWASSDGYETPPREHRSGLFASWQWAHRKFQVQASLRETLVKGSTGPLTPALGIDWQWSNALTWKARISRNYRLPTLNDRYWRPGGNPDLRPESGWSMESTLEYRQHTDHLATRVAVTAYSRRIENWILWYTEPGRPFWSVGNVARVWSRGLEPRWSLDYQNGDFSLRYDGAYDLVHSTNEIALTSPSIRKGSQLLYTPVHQFKSGITATWHSWEVSYRHQWVGGTKGINEDLDPFQVGQVHIRYARPFRKWRSSFFLNLDNIWNQTYQIIERRPMPGRNVRLGIELNFKKIKE